MDIPIDPQAVKSGFDAVKSAIDIVKGLRDLYRTKPDALEDINEKIRLAERQVVLGEAQIAQALGYKLCKAHFPPVPMLKDRVNPKYVEEVAKCPTCGAEEPSPEYFAERARQDRAIENYNARLDGDSWLSR